jgi:hypothetical protein
VVEHRGFGFAESFDQVGSSRFQDFGSFWLELGEWHAIINFFLMTCISPKTSLAADYLVVHPPSLRFAIGDLALRLPRA